MKKIMRKEKGPGGLAPGLRMGRYQRKGQEGKGGQPKGAWYTREGEEGGKRSKGGKRGGSAGERRGREKE